MSTANSTPNQPPEVARFAPQKLRANTLQGMLNGYKKLRDDLDAQNRMVEQYIILDEVRARLNGFRRHKSPCGEFCYPRTFAAARNPLESAPGKYLLFTQVTRGAVPTQASLRLSARRLRLRRGRCPRLMRRLIGLMRGLVGLVRLIGVIHGGSSGYR